MNNNKCKTKGKALKHNQIRNYIFLLIHIPVKKIVTPLLLVFCLITGEATFAQEIPDEILQNSLYSQSKDIINGTKWIYEKKYRGSPFLVGNNWAIGNVTYNGKFFKGVSFNCNLYTDEFIIFHSEKGNKKFVVLQKAFLKNFSYMDTETNKNRYFEYIKLPGTKQKRLYEIAYKGKSLFLIRHIKAVRGKVADGFLGDYISAVDLYLKVGDKFETFSSKKDLLNILGKHIPELKKIIKKNKFKINKHHYKNIAPLIEYFDKLETLAISPKMKKEKNVLIE